MLAKKCYPCPWIHPKKKQFKVELTIKISSHLNLSRFNAYVKNLSVKLHTCEKNLSIKFHTCTYVWLKLHSLGVHLNRKKFNILIKILLLESSNQKYLKTQTIKDIKLWILPPKAF